MGSTLSKENLLVQQQKDDILDLWPGLEPQLEASFEAFDLKNEKHLSLNVLEPAARHHLMQLGLLEYVARFTGSSGNLDDSHIRHILEKFGIRDQVFLDVTQWKSYVVSWIVRIHEEQINDVENWKRLMKQEQENSEMRYRVALENFKTHYIDQLKSYYRNVNEIHEKEQKYREEWETCLSLQEKFYRQQLCSIKQKNTESEREYKQISNLENVLSIYQKHIAGGRRRCGNITATSYLYPVEEEGYGAPISGGCLDRTKKVLVHTPI